MEGSSSKVASGPSSPLDPFWAAVQMLCCFALAALNGSEEEETLAQCVETENCAPL